MKYHQDAISVQQLTIEFPDAGDVSIDIYCKKLLQACSETRIALMTPATRDDRQPGMIHASTSLDPGNQSKDGSFTTTLFEQQDNHR